MTDGTLKKKSEPVTLFPVSGKTNPKFSPGRPPETLPIEPLTLDEYDRALKEGLPDRSRRSDDTGNDSS
jgi:hypothetical protein